MHLEEFVVLSLPDPTCVLAARHVAHDLIADTAATGINFRKSKGAPAMRGKHEDHAAAFLRCVDIALVVGGFDVEHAAFEPEPAEGSV